MMTYEQLKQELAALAELVGKYPESLQERVFELLVGSLTAKDAGGKQNADSKLPRRMPATERIAPSKKAAGKKQTYQLLKDLDLGKKGDKASFQSLIVEKRPESNIQFNALSVYYLKNTAHIEKVTIDHVYTCYQNVGRRPPKNLPQSIWDTSGKRYGYIDLAGDDMKMSHIGTTLVEHDLPPKSK